MNTSTVFYVTVLILSLRVLKAQTDACKEDQTDVWVTAGQMFRDPFTTKHCLSVCFILRSYNIVYLSVLTVLPILKYIKEM